ncbi:hypothetical protein N825_34085 [Skermanella stibiiresistens SB22]|uniref:Uncharacterized protein n=1 Tax=Skermanella stibiiresistens SB22 TaxID=1385369 RepID=W9GQ06_9PROT|nr:hypothetical protein [Skermanella stibiiresistens]EWY35844.1 hypothetical protein N825_34085 [Skermanella stibiiresistens SB22]
MISGIGVYIWSVLSAVSVLFAIAKPILKLTDDIERYSKLYGEHTTTYMALKTIEEDMKRRHVLAQEHIDQFMAVRARAAELARLDDIQPLKKLILQLQQDVITEIPVESLWMPK